MPKNVALIASQLIKDFRRLQERYASVKQRLYLLECNEEEDRFSDKMVVLDAGYEVEWREADKRPFIITDNNQSLHFRIGIAFGNDKLWQSYQQLADKSSDLIQNKVTFRSDVKNKWVFWIYSLFHLLKDNDLGWISDVHYGRHDLKCGVIDNPIGASICLLQDPAFVPKQKKRRRKVEPREPTAKQLEAFWLVREHGLAEAVRRLKKDRKTVQEHHDAVIRKLGKKLLPKHKTGPLSHDLRDQINISEDDDIRRSRGY